MKLFYLYYIKRVELLRSNLKDLFLLRNNVFNADG